MLKYWRREFVKVLTAAEVDEKFCIKFMCKYSQYTDIGELLADVLSQYMHTRRPKNMVFNIPVHVACPAQLRLFLEEVRLHYEGRLRLDLPHSYQNYVPCDDIIKALTGAR